MRAGKSLDLINLSDHFLRIRRLMIKLNQVSARPLSSSSLATRRGGGVLRGGCDWVGFGGIKGFLKGC